MNVADSPIQGSATPLTSETLLKQLDAVHDLPTLPAVAQRVNTMLQDINTPAQDLAKVIEKDHAIVPKLLRLVNSAFYGFNQKISSVSHAIMLIGFNTVRNAVISVAVIDSLRLKKQFKGFDITQFWNHAVAVATVSRYLDAQNGRHHKENSFTAGLIHDLGRILMANFYPEHFSKVLQTMQEQKISLLAAERQHFPLQHDIIGAYLARRWKLPDVLKKTIAFHHHPEKQGDDHDLTCIVHVADALVHSYLEPRKEKIPIHAKAWQTMASQIQSVRQWMPEIKQEVQEACQVLLERE